MLSKLLFLSLSFLLFLPQTVDAQSQNTLQSQDDSPQQVQGPQAKEVVPKKPVDLKTLLSQNPEPVKSIKISIDQLPMQTPKSSFVFGNITQEQIDEAERLSKLRASQQVKTTAPVTREEVQRQETYVD